MYWLHNHWDFLMGLKISLVHVHEIHLLNIGLLYEIYFQMKWVMSKYDIAVIWSPDLSFYDTGINHHLWEAKENKKV